MDADPDRDLRLLNALVDGELSAADRAAAAERLAVDRNFARAYATLARLKACVVADVETAPEIALPVAAGQRRWRLSGLGLTAAALAIGLIVGVGFRPERQPEFVAAAPPAALRIAAGGYAALVPDLSGGGLALTGIETDAANGSTAIVASYRGPRGCRLQLRVGAATPDAPSPSSARRQSRIAGGLAYELIAFGMPADRFDAVARAAMLATRPGPGPGPDRPDLPLREARMITAPCLG